MYGQFILVAQDLAGCSVLTSTSVCARKPEEVEGQLGLVGGELGSGWEQFCSALGS